MPKSQKSSATSATRKKHARKAVGGEQLLPLPKEKKEKAGKKGKGKNAELRQKTFIPPSRPAPIRPDPLTSTGLASRLPPELLVILRRLAKKDPTTRQKALEELNTAWLARTTAEAEASLTVALPVWLHHAPTLFFSASRRLRVLAAQTHFAWLRTDGPRTRLVQLLRGEAPLSQIAALLGAWRMAAEDIDRAVTTAARRSWDLIFHKRPSPDGDSDFELNIILDSELLDPLFEFVQRTLLYPSDVYAELNPVQPAAESVPPPHAVRGKSASKQPIRPVRPAVEDDESPRQTEEDEDRTEERNGRIRVGALGALRWLMGLGNTNSPKGIDELLSSPLLWTGLYHGSSPPFCHHIQTTSGPLGKDQPAIRKVTWSILLTLLNRHDGEIEVKFLTVISQAVLRSAWSEPDSGVRSGMWEPLLRFLTKNPKAWEKDLELSTAAASGHESDGESDEDDSDFESDQEHSNQPSRLSAHQSEAFREFLQFLQLRCYGTPSQSYPTIIIILSTIPSSIIGPNPSSWTDFLTSFWAALDGRALSRGADATLFLNSLLECLILLIRRSKAIVTGTDEPRVVANVETEFVKATLVVQVERVWAELASGRLGAEDTAGTALFRVLMNLFNIESALWEAAWATMSDTTKTACIYDEKHKDNGARLSRQLFLLRAVRAQSAASSDNEHSRRLLQAINDLLTGIMATFIDQLEISLSTNQGLNDEAKWAAQMVGEVLKSFADEVFKDPKLSSRIDSFMQSRPDVLLNIDVGLCTTYIVSRGNQSICRSVWQAVLKALSSSSDLLQHRLPALLSAAETGLLPSFLRPSTNDEGRILEQIMDSQLEEVLEQNRNPDIMRRLFQTPDPFLSRQAASSLLHRTLEVFNKNVQLLMFEDTSAARPNTAFSIGSSSSDFDSDTKKLNIPLSLVSSTLEVRPEVLQETSLHPMLLPFFSVGYLLSSPGVGESTVDDVAAQARAIWQTVMQSPIASQLLSSARALCRDLIPYVACRISPDVVIRAFTSGYLGSVNLLSIITELFPSHETLDEMASTLPPDPLDASLAVIDPLVQPGSLFSHTPAGEADRYDSQGCSTYSRIMNALIKVVSEERSLLHTNPWMLRHLIILFFAASDRRMVRGLTSPYFSQSVSEDLLLSIERNAKMLTSFALINAGSSGTEFHTEILQAYATKDAFKLNDEGLAPLVLSVLEAARRSDVIRDARALHMVLQHVLNGAEANDAEKWLSFSQKIGKQNPNTALSIVLAVTRSGLEPPSIVRLRNELAAGALGIRPSKARTDGLALLRRLSASVPYPDSDVAFLPQNRAVNFVKACQSWLSAEEEEEEEDDADTGVELETEMTHIFQHLAPVLQLVTGAHWELFFDLIEENLENCSFNEASSFPLLARTLELVNIVRDLAQSNRTLREDWSPREGTIFTLVKKLVENAPVTESKPTSVPRDVCWELALGMLQDMPASLIDHETLPQMVHLLQDPTPDAAIKSYTILCRAAEALTEHLVVEAGVDTSDEVMKFELPTELLDVLQSSLEPGSTESNIVAYLLGWMILFDLFEDASLRLKMGYGNQLRDLDLVDTSFLPVVFELLDIGGGTKAFPLELWSVDQFYLECYDPELPLSARLLAAHLLYRAVLHIPSLVTTWWTNCKDRQLSAAFRTLITRHYSPLLINSEFAHLRSSGLSGDEWTVRIAQNTGEVNVSYVVDEQSLEICVEIPSDFPLHSVKVRENRRLGIEDKKWRAWLLAVQQIITSQNGRVADGISLFKKNVTSHFEDQTECAICYSIISVTEFTLPKKRCKTCKNRFHAGCLYKWFNTSHTSACPLCRSDFI